MSFQPTNGSCSRNSCQDNNLVNGSEGLARAASRQRGVVISVSAPGKVILHGEHSVVHGKLAIAASLGLRTKLTLVELEPNLSEHNSVSIILHALDLVRSYKLDEIRSELLDSPLPLIKGVDKFDWHQPQLIDHDALLDLVKRYIVKSAGPEKLDNFQDLALTSLFYLFTAMLGAANVPIRPFSLIIETDLTVSAGTGSSASYLVCLAGAFVQYIKSRSKESLRNGHKTPAKFERADLDLISKWAHCAEQIIHGTASGVDNTICTYGSIVEFRKGSVPKMVQVLHRFKLLLVNTKVARDTMVMVSRVNVAKKNHPLIIDNILDAMDLISKSALVYLGRLSDIGPWERAEGEERFKTVEYYNKLGELTDMNQGLLKSLGVSHPTLDLICNILKEYGLHGKLTGAGGGGYAIALIPPDFEPGKLDNLVNKLHSEHFDAVITDLGGPGVTADL